MQYHAVTSQGRLVIHLRERFTYTDQARFKEIVGLIVQGEATECVFDCSGLEFIDSTAVGMLVIANDEARKKGARLQLINAQGQVQRIIKVVDLRAIMSVDGSVPKS